ncbi:MAG: hydrogenase formation protein HypD [Planctomycetes bacterium]|nr:hydrogenase formation protein HypD [Planctomycetota bacterium]
MVSEPSIDGFHDPKAAKALQAALAGAAGRAGRPLKFMEVCGTHTMAIARSGLRAFLPPSVDLVSGPGCPVCVTPDAYVDAAVRLVLDLGASVATFGDMVRVPGARMSLEQARGRGGIVRIVYSPVDALDAAKADPSREWVFLAVGFETTAPGVAATVRRAREERVGNFSVLCGHKTVPVALHALLDDPEIALDGFLCPGHVSVIIGPEAYESVARRGSPCVVAGFEPLDILQSLAMLAEQKAAGRSEVEVQYFRAVKPGGNPRARAVLDEVFEPCDARWRGIGPIPGSGLRLREAFRGFDAALRFGVETEGPDAP